MDPTPAAPWVVVVPLKAGAAVKSRLSELSAPQRTELARAFVEDCARAALDTDGVAAVLVVTDDAEAAAHLAHIGCTVVQDLPAAGLNAAVLHGTHVARARWTGCWVAVLHSDVAAVRSSELALALAEARQHERAFVPDISGRGTNLLTAAPDVPLLPRFEGASSEAHLASGAVLLPCDVPSIRCDIDDAASLHLARSLGVGPATSAALSTVWPGDGAVAAGRGRRSGTGAPPPPVELPGRVYDGQMQATVASYDAETRSGSVLADDGVRLPFTAEALAGSRLRLLRPGQRVRVETDPDGTIRQLQIVTLSG